MEQRRGYHRMRVAKACLSCRQRKVKCDRPSTTGKCKACQRRRTECIMTDAPGNPSSRPSSEQSPRSWAEEPHAKLVHGVSLARPMRIPELDPLSTAESQRDVFGSPPERNAEAFSEGLAPDPFLGPEPVLNLPSHLFSGLSTAGVGLASPCPALDMVLSSPCFALPRCLFNQSESNPSVSSLFSPSGLQWFQEKAGHAELDKTLPLVEQITPEDGDDGFDPFTSTPRNTPYLPLPPKAIALRLFDVYFTRVNPFCPLFDEEDFMYRIDQQYPAQPQTSPTWWACINATLALACMVEEEFSPNAWLYWKNCSMSLGSFFMQPPQLLAAQALLGMTVFLFGNFGSKPSDALVSMAIRILHALDFTNGRPGEPIDVYKRILALCYAQDIETALRTGIPPIQIVDIHFLSGPESRWEDFAPPVIGNISGFNIYHSFCGLTVIKNQVYRQLYSALADDKDDTEVIAAVGDLDQQLSEWKSNIPDEYQPESTSADIGLRRDPHLTVLYMHFSYYDCLMTIHRRGMESATWAMQLGRNDGSSVRSSNPRALLSRQISVAAARASLDLVRYITPDHILCAGLVASFVVSALTTLSSSIVDDPSTARVKADMERMKNVERFYLAISVSRTDREVFGLLEQCAHHRILAEKAIKRSLRSKMALTSRR